MKRVLLPVLLLIVVACFCSMPVPALSKEQKKGGYSPKESFEDFSKKLNLTKEQKEKIRPILNEEVDKIKQAYREAWEKELQIMEGYQQKVMEVLNPQQQEKYRKMIEERKKKHQSREKGKNASAEADIPVVVTVVVAEPVTYYGKSVVAEGYVKRVLSKDAFILSEAPNGVAEIVVVGAGPAIVKAPKAGQKVAVRGVFQNFKIDAVEKQLGANLDEGIFGTLENKPGIFARWVEKL